VKDSNTGPVSEQNVELVRATMETYSRGEYDQAVTAFHPDVEWSVGAEIMPDPDVFHGREGVLAFWALWSEAFEGFELVIEDCREVGDAHVLARTRSRGRGAGSGATVDSPPFVQLMEVRDGQVVRVWMYGSESTALRAAGLSGE
jgi:ketosteroid isomerase-like protein